MNPTHNPLSGQVVSRNGLVYAQRVAVAEARLPDWTVREGARDIVVCGKVSAAVLRAISSLAPAGGLLFASRARVAEKAQVSVRHVSRALAALCAMGALTRRGYVVAWGRRLAAYRVAYSAIRRWVPEAVRARLRARCVGCHRGTQGSKSPEVPRMRSLGGGVPRGTRLNGVVKKVGWALGKGSRRFEKGETRASRLLELRAAMSSPLRREPDPGDGGFVERIARLRAERGLA